MWMPESRALVGDVGARQALSDDKYRLLAPPIPPSKPGSRPRTTGPASGCAGLSRGAVCWHGHRTCPSAGDCLPAMAAPHPHRPP
jgi:hypothetical protein